MSRFKTLSMILGLAFLTLPGLAMAGPIYVRDSTGALTQPDLKLKTVELTFDDGPSEYTSKILDILRAKGVPATFFAVGSQALQHQSLRDEYNDGHEIGNHTYSHSDLTKLPGWRLQLELSLSRLIIESQTGHSTRDR